MLLNKERAMQVMDRHNLAALVAREHINIYYLTDYWDTQADGRWPYLVYGVLPRDQSAPAALVLPTVKLDRLTLWPTWVPNVVAYSDYSGRQQITQPGKTADEPTAAPWLGWPVREDAKLTTLEKNWVRLAQDHASRLAATPAWGLRRAMKEAGLSRGRIGCDDPRILEWMQEMGLPDIEIVDATNLFREIRMVKSSNEIDLMRASAQINERACFEAVAVAKEGVKWTDVENAYHVAMSRQGGRNGHIITSLGGLPHGEIVRHRPFLVDALGEYRNYFGDFGRTVVVGQPDDETLRRASALKAGFDAACMNIKPGVKKSEIISLTIEVVRKEGFPEFFYVSPHSVGLEHTDQPLPLGPTLHGDNTDFRIEKDMVLNIDMPYFEWGWGTMHLEDTVLVEEDGVEALTSMSDPLIINSS